MSENSITLYDTTGDFVAILDLMANDAADLNEEQETAIMQAIEQHVTKVEGVARVLRHFETMAQFARAEAERLAARAKHFEGEYRRLSAYVLNVMEERGLDELEGKTATLKIRNNPPAVLIGAEDLIPAEFKTIKQEITIDKNAVKARLKAGLEVPGATLTRGRKVVVA